MTSALEIATRASVLLVVTAAVELLLTRRGAAPATRHAALVASGLGVLVLPLACLVLPAFEVNVTPPPLAEATPAHAAPVAPAENTNAANSAPPGPWLTPAGPHPWVATWYLGAALLLTWLFLQMLGWRLLAWRAKAVDAVPVARQFRALRELMGVPDAELRDSRRVRGPVCLGVWRPIVLVPSSFAGWTESARDVVLRHELAHAVRRDQLGNVLMLVLRAIYWFHPLVWWMTGRAVLTREMACDRLVVDRGCDPFRYAQELVEVAHRDPIRNAATILAIRSGAPALRARLNTLFAPAARPARRRTIAISVAAVVVVTAILTWRTSLHDLIDRTRAADPATRRAALLELAETPRSWWFKEVLPLTGDPDPSVRAAAIWAVSRIGCHPAFLTTTAHLSDPSPEVRGVAAVSLEGFDTPLLDLDQRGFFHRQWAEYRTILAKWIGVPHTGTARQRLEAARRDASAWVRRSAEATLARHRASADS